MISELKPYAQYRESGLPWVGEMPGHWEVKRLKNLAHFQSGEGITSLQIEDTGPFPVYGGNGLRGYTSRYTHDGHFALIGRQGALCGNINFVQGKFFASEHAVVTSLHGSQSVVWFGELLRIMNLNQYAQSAAQPGLAVERIKNLYAPLPPPAEQEAIVRFLDWANSRLERAIRAKRKVIALLNEQKQAIIHRAVTRGLDPSVRLKPSGISWLGDIPEHWEVMRAKQVARIFIPQRDKPDLNDQSGYPWITPVNVGREHPDKICLFVTKSAAEAIGARMIPHGSVVATCIGRFGIASITKEAVVVNQQLQAFIPYDSISAAFLRYIVQASRPYFETKSNSTTLAYVDRQGFGDMPLLFPPRAEQQEIERHLSISLERIETLENRNEREISLLHEYRTRLISDVVTGKLDVRKAAADLPDETTAQELQPEDATQEPLTDLDEESELFNEEARV